MLPIECESNLDFFFVLFFLFHFGFPKWFSKKWKSMLVLRIFLFLFYIICSVLFPISHQSNQINPNWRKKNISSKLFFFLLRFDFYLVSLHTYNNNNHQSKRFDWLITDFLMTMIKWFKKKWINGDRYAIYRFWIEILIKKK